MSAMPPSRLYDVLVVGAGHNGLVAAAVLAKAGLSVLVVERRPVLGGAAATEEVFPGFRVNTGAIDAGLFLPEIAAELRLENQGLRLLFPPAVIFAPQPDGTALTLWRDRQRTFGEIARYSDHDARSFPAYLERLSRLSGALRTILTLTPPSLPEYQYGELLPWLRMALQVKGLGKTEMMEFLRLLPLPVEDFLDEWFETPALKGALGSAGVMSSMQGPKASGTTFRLLYQAIGAGEAGFRASSFVEGGMGRLMEALASTARLYGAEICAGVGVAEILLDGERVTGLRLENDQQFFGRVVLSSADPRTTFFGLVGAPNLEVRFVREVKNIKFRGSTARVNLALSGLPRFRGASNELAQLSGHILVCPSLEYLERAYDDAKYGDLSHSPCLDATLPTVIDASLAPPGQHLMSVDVRYAPYHLEGGWDAQREFLAARVINILEGVAPGIGSLVMKVQVITPLDYEREYGLPEGSADHGQMGLDQLLFMRPVAGYGRYRTPVEGLYLCGAGAHPGGGVTGAPGYNAARQVLKDLKKGI